MLQVLQLPSLFDERVSAGAIAIALSATMLRLARDLSMLSHQRTLPSSAAVQAVSVMLIGIAIWWPGILLSPDLSALSAPSLVPVILALMIAIGACASGTTASRSSRGTFVTASLSTWAVAMGYGLIVTPKAFSTWSELAPWALSLMMTVLAWSLVHLQREADSRARGLLARVGPALCAATTVAVSAYFSGVGVSDSAVAWSQTVTIAGIALIAGVLVGVLKHERPIVHEEPRIQRSAPSIDSLTKLPTRADFEERLAAHVAKADASKSCLALLFIDLDGFKPVNDTFGHNSGDLVLKQVGERLRSLSRSDDAVTRIGGDEFILLATGNPTQEAVSQIAKRLIDSVSRPYNIGDREVVISCSIGIVLYPESGAHTKLIARADAAMYEAKRSGGGCYCFYTPAMDEDSRDKFDLVSDLRQAIEKREMELFYQPKIDVRSGQVTAAEALLRWKHPKRGMVSPAVFIPLAERYGLISMLGNWVIEDACRQARRWRDRGLRMRVAINLSALQMRQEDVVQHIVGALQRYRIDPSLLTCEITESVAMEDTKATQETFRRLGKAGIHLSIDDFGTGYSSLSYLRRLPAEELKIDRTFVMDLEDSADARSVVDAVIKLAHALSLRVVAEGVETQRQQQILVEMGCDEMQGYLFAKPMSARALLLWAIDDGPDTTTFRASLFEDTAAAGEV